MKIQAAVMQKYIRVSNAGSANLLQLFLLSIVKSKRKEFCVIKAIQLFFMM
nr:MAG TPA: hypothetical protein [Caudoviricetes sp.]